MRLHVMRVCVAATLLMAVLVSGCTELYMIFGPGGFFGPEQSSVSGTTTQPTVIAAPVFISDQTDPLFEMTAGAKVVARAQLNDDNGDGVIDDNDDADFVSGSDESQPIQIHLNQGVGVAFSTISIAGGGPITRMVDIEIADIDVDGRPDIAVLINDTGYVPEDNADLRGAVVLLFNPADPSVAEDWVEVNMASADVLLNLPFRLSSDSDGMTDFAVVDIDLDMEADGVTPKGPDVVLGSNEIDEGNQHIRLYLNPGNSIAGAAHQSRTGDQWVHSLVSSDAVPFKAMEVADIDDDGDVDVVATFPSAKTYNVRWLENPRYPSGVAAVSNRWNDVLVGQQQDGGDYMDIADIDGDGDTDVAVVKESERLIQWFENPLYGTGVALLDFPRDIPWRVFNFGLVQEGFSINQMQLVDLNVDGQVDCFVTASGSMAGMQRGSELYDYWDAFTILATNPVATVGRCAFADLNSDGLLDFVAPLDRDGLTEDQILIFTRLTP